MFLEMLLFLFLGVSMGTITGLIPGLHPNTIFIIILSFSPLMAIFPASCILVFIISTALSNTFTNFIPTILFGAPEADSCLSVLPSHKLLLEGRGYEALFLTVCGGVGVTLLTILTFPLLLYILPNGYEILHTFIHAILIFIAVWMCISDKNRLASFLVFLLAGLFGFVTLNTLPSETALFPALTGLFGFSALLITAVNKTRIPPQQECRNLNTSHLKGSLAGWFAGMITGILPGIGAAQAGVIAAQLFKAKTKDFLTALGGINTANIFFTFIVFYTLGKTRSGASWAISQLVESITIHDIILLVCVGVIACFVSAFLTIKIGRFMIRRISKLNYDIINKCVIALLVALILLFSGPTGILVAFVGTCIGLLAILSGIRRTHLMGFLILPTILYFSGMNIFLLGLFGI